jgi:hypothetical protein
MRQNKQLVRLTEGDLHRIIKESVNKVLNESDNTFNYNKGHRHNFQNGIITDMLHLTYEDIAKVYHALHMFDYDPRHEDEYDQGLDEWFQIILSNARKINQNYTDNLDKTKWKIRKHW